MIFLDVCVSTHMPRHTYGGQVSPSTFTQLLGIKLRLSDLATSVFTH